MTRSKLRAAVYLRYSSDKQDGSDEQQNEAVLKLVDREGYRLVGTYRDEGISGDTGRDSRPDFDRLLRDAEAGRFDVVVCWAVDRLGRQDSADGAETLRVFKRAGVVIHAVADGRIDPRQSMDRLRWAFGAENANQENRRRAYNVVRGQVSNAQAGNRNGAVAPFGFDRAQYDGSGKLVRRLAPGQYVDTKGHHVRLIPCQDPEKLAGVRFVYRRFVTADVSLRQIARELDGKGYPSPTGAGWSVRTVGNILRSPIYCGDSRWAARHAGRYHAVSDGQIVPAEEGHGEEGGMIVKGTHKGIVSRKVWRAAKRKLDRLGKRRGGRHAVYPLSGKVFCQHCGAPMTGQSNGGKGRYLCSTYRRDSRACHHHAVDAAALVAWLVPKLQEIMTGPGRAELVKRTAKRLRANAKGGDAEAKRLRKRLAELDAEIGNLVKAVRLAPDVSELVAELAEVKRERAAVADELDRMGTVATPADATREAERRVSETYRLVGVLSRADPGTLRGLFGQLVSRIECRWEPAPEGVRAKRVLAEGRVILRPNPLLATSLNGHQGTACSRYL